MVIQESEHNLIYIPYQLISICCINHLTKMTKKQKATGTLKQTSETSRIFIWLPSNVMANIPNVRANSEMPVVMPRIDGSLQPCNTYLLDICYILVIIAFVWLTKFRQHKWLWPIVPDHLICLKFHYRKKDSNSKLVANWPFCFLSHLA